MRALRWTGYLTSLLLASVLAGLLLLLLTPAGTYLVVNVAARFAPELTIEGWRGTLITSICARTVHYRNDQLDLVLEDLCLTPSLWASMEYLYLDADAASATSFSITVLDGPQPLEQPDNYLPSIPFRIAVREIDLERLNFYGQSLSAIQGRLDLRPASIDGSLDFVYEDLKVSALATGPWRMPSVSGSIRGGGSAEYTIALNLAESRLPYQARLTANAVDLTRWSGTSSVLNIGKLEITGDRHNYDFAISTELEDTSLGLATLKVQGSGDAVGAAFAAGAVITPLSAAIPDAGRLNAFGKLTWQPTLNIDAQLKISDATLALPDLDTTLSAAATINAQATAFSADITEVVGQANDFPVAGALRISRRDSTLHVDALQLRIGGGNLEAQGSVIESALIESLSIDATAADVPLEAFNEQIKGIISGTLNIRNGLSKGAIRTDIEVSNAMLGQRAAQQIEVAFTGNRESGSALVSLQLNDSSSLKAQGDIEFQGAELFGRFDTVDASYTVPELGHPVRLRLNAPASFTASLTTFEISQACFASTAGDLEPGEVCLTAEYPDGGATLEMRELHVPPLNLPNSDVWLNGILAGDARIDRFEPLSGDFAIRASDLQARIEDYQRALGSLTLAGNINDNSVSLSLNTPIEQVLVAKGAMNSTIARPLSDSTISGDVSVTVAGVRLIEEFLPMDLAYEVSQLQGQLRAEARFEGTLGTPVVTGRLSAEEAGGQLEVTGTTIRSGTIEANIVDSQHIELTASAAVGEGNMVLSGTLDNLGTETSTLQAALTLDHAHVVDLPDYSAKISGDLGLTVTPQRLNITGNLMMPWARIELADLPEGAVEASSDTVDVHAQQQPEQQLRNTKLDLRLGDDVRLDAFGLKTRLLGELELREIPGRPPELHGEITLEDGQVNAYGQKLDLRRGELTFVGPVDNPLVNVVASKIIEREEGPVEVFLVLTGSADNIETQIRSTPEFREGDALALLLTGRTLTEMSTGEQSNVYGTAIALGLYGASDFTRSLMTTMRVEEIIVKDDEGEWEVGAALRLQRNLYLRYTYSVYSRLGGVLLRYALTDRVSVRGRTGDTHSIELRYGID